MRTSIINIAFLFIVPFCISAQSILLVNDNDFILRNTDTLIKDMVKLNLDFDVFDIEQNGGIAPGFSKMNAYNLIIWYTSSDKDALKFWDSVTEADIKKFIDSGKVFWIIGLDFIADKYGSPPKEFNSSELLYAYFGIKKYAVQSYEDDDFKGCSELDKASNSFSDFSDKIYWNLPGVWWIDGCDLAPLSRPIYYMGPTTYKLAGSISMFTFQSDKRKTMTTLFDPIGIDNEANRLKFFQASLDFINVLADQSQVEISEIQILPNPASDKLLINTAEKVKEIDVYDLSGKQHALSYSDYNLNISNLPRGQYILKIFINGKNPIIKKFYKL